MYMLRGKKLARTQLYSGPQWELERENGEIQGDQEEKISTTHILLSQPFHGSSSHKQKLGINSDPLVCMHMGDPTWELSEMPEKKVSCRICGAVLPCR